MKCCGNNLRRADHVCNGICPNGHRFLTNRQAYALIAVLLAAFGLAVGVTVWWAVR